MPVSRCLDRQIVVYPHDRILLNNKGGELWINTSRVNLAITVLSERHQTGRKKKKKYILFGSL